VAFVWKKKKLLYNPSWAVGNLEDHLLFLSSFVDLIESKQTKIFGISLSPTGTVCVRHIIGNQSNRPNGATSKFIRWRTTQILADRMLCWFCLFVACFWAQTVSELDGWRRRHGCCCCLINLARQLTLP
jgi:hypothetical protein